MPDDRAKAGVATPPPDGPERYRYRFRFAKRNGPFPELFGFSHFYDRFGVCLGFKDFRLFEPFGFKDSGLFAPLCF